MARIPGYRLHRPSGRAVVTLNGRDHYLGVHGSAESKAAYKRLIAEYKSSGKRMCYGVEPDESTLAMLISDYSDWAEQNQPVKEFHQIVYAIRHLDDYHDVRLADFGPIKLKAVMDAMVNKVGHASHRASHCPGFGSSDIFSGRHHRGKVTTSECFSTSPAWTTPCREWAQRSNTRSAVQPQKGSCGSLGKEATGRC